MIVFFERIKYGLQRLWSEMFKSEEDYWHCREKALTPKEYTDDVYFLDMSDKGLYPGEMKEDIPVFYLDGRYPVLFHITILNYGLGLLNRLKKGEQVKGELLAVVDFLLKNQDDGGAWRYKFPKGVKHELADGGASGMTQGLAISFLVRCCRIGLIDTKCCEKAITKAKEVMVSEECVTSIGNIHFIEEFHTPGTSILNGSIFALFGLYDYAKFIGDQTLFQRYLADLKLILPRFKLSFWSYYNLDKMVCSKFYQQLHIDQMNALFNLTGDETFKEYAERWTFGLKIAPVFILVKAVQKFIHLKDITMNYANRQNCKK